MRKRRVSQASTSARYCCSCMAFRPAGRPRRGDVRCAALFPQRPATRPTLRARSYRPRDTWGHKFRRRHRYDLGHSDRRAHYRRAVKRADSARRIRHLAAHCQRPGNHRRRRAGPLPTARQPQNVRVTSMVIRIVIALAALLVSPSALAKELNSIGITVGSLGNPFFNALAKGAEAKAKQINPRVKVTTVSADYDLNKQFTHVDNFIASGVDLILINAADPKAAAPAIRRAQRAGIIVIAVDEIGRAHV